jgi:error-prone DNA polymerase
VIRGKAQVTQGTASLVADAITPLDLRALAGRSRDFR